MTVQKLLTHCWSFEYVALEYLNGGEPVVEPEEATSLCELHPEVADLHVRVFFIGTRFINCLKKSVPVLVVEVE